MEVLPIFKSAFGWINFYNAYPAHSSIALPKLLFAPPLPLLNLPFDKFIHFDERGPGTFETFSSQLAGGIKS